MRRFGAGLVLILVWAAAAAAQPATYDVVVYGGTAGGVITAVAAAREGAKVVLLEPQRHLGGMVSGGLGWTDFGKKEVIGGLSLDYFARAGRRYVEAGIATGVPVGRDTRPDGRVIQWHIEPHVAEAIFKEMAAEAGVTVLYGHRLRERTGVTKDPGDATRVTRIAMENGAAFAGAIFVDASYEGDLMAQAKVTYTYGRESSAQYGESLAGVRDRTPLHQFLVSVPAHLKGTSGALLPEINPAPKAASGSADRLVQAYNYRLCMTKVPENRVPFPKPRGYDASRFALLGRMLPLLERYRGKPLTIVDVMKPDPIPNGKTDTNNNGAFSTDFIGGSWDYPEADYKTRARIWQAHTDYIQGFLYFLTHDPQVPASLHAEMQPWGLCKDEFTDNGNWPHQLYVRESRRMVGEYVMSQKDIQTDLSKPDVIGMGSYNSDSHNVQRIVNADGFAENEGDMQVAVTPYQIPYSVMLPKRGEATNLLVPVAFSASHVAYSTLRMEPQYMIIGQAAGVAASMAIRGKTAVQDIDRAALTATLRKQGAVREWVKPAPPAAPSK